MDDQRIDTLMETAESEEPGNATARVHAQALRRLTELARVELPPAVPVGASTAAYLRFRDAAAMRRAGELAARRPAKLVLSLGCAAVVAVAGGLAAWHFAAGRPLMVTVTDGALDEGGFVRSAPAADSPTLPPSLRFSDGTQVDLGPASRARVADTTQFGARVLLEDGRARARVVPRHGAQWWFDAGPCRVQVTGTHFDMHWSAPRQVLEVMLYSGSVTVKGPPATGGVPMRAGQYLVMDVRQSSVRLTELGAAGQGQSHGLSDDQPAAQPAEKPQDDQPEESPTADGAPGAAAGSAGIGVTGAEGGAAVRARESWPARVLAGDFRTVIREAERRGVDKVLRREPAENVMALADAARYARAFPLALKALLQVRTRFPRTAAASRSAFLLGRMAEDQGGNLARASEWYDTYLADAPDDAFRAEAMGRQMTATLQLGRRDRARELAGQYLRRYPQGAYARAARAIRSP